MDRIRVNAAKEVERCSLVGAMKFQQNDLQKALEAYWRAYLSSVLLGSDGHMQRTCAFNVAAACITTGSFTEALAYLKKAVPPDDQQLDGDLFFNFGLAYEGLARVAEMKDAYRRSLKQYEGNNARMQVEVLTRLSRACVMEGQLGEARACQGELTQICARLGDSLGCLKAQLAQALLCVALGDPEQAELMADRCFKTAQGMVASREKALILLELALVYTHTSEFNKAWQCCQSVRPSLDSGGSEPGLSALLHQNLGVIHSLQGEFQQASHHFHTGAGQYAEIKNRRGQCHCFVNLAYAYSQLQQLDQARQFYRHGLQAAKDAGDLMSEWQCLEALGSVAWLSADLPLSQGYFQSALLVLAKSLDAGHVSVQDRILQKLVYVLQEQVRPNHYKITEKGEQSFPVQKNSIFLSQTRSQRGSVIALKKDGKIKYLRVRRSGTLHKFNKVALGLDVAQSTNQSPARQTSLGLDMSDEVFSASSLNISDVDEEEFNETFQEAESSEMSDTDEDHEDSQSEDEDQKNVLEAMQRIASQPSTVEPLAASQRQVIADIHNNDKTSDDEDDVYMTSNTNSSESSESGADDRHGPGADDRQKGVRTPPPIPSLLPSTSLSAPVRTYETPVASKTELKGGGPTPLANTEGSEGNNFFHSPRPLCVKSGAARAGSIADQSPEYPIYETLQKSSYFERRQSSIDDFEAQTRIRGSAEFKASGQGQAERTLDRHENIIKQKKKSRACHIM